ncbi:MAG: hypothetical protein RJA57_1180 [Bacteroidota bacterium]|jgi:peroxiredoxin
MALPIGTPAPDFTLFSDERNPVTLSECKGQPVVLLFFPLAFTSVCTTELCAVRDTMATYNELQARVFGISVDTPQTLARFREEQRLNFNLLSDFNKEASRAYGCIYEQFGMNMRGVSKRGAFVIDKDGIVRHAEVLENAGELPDFGTLVAVLRTLE